MSHGAFGLGQMGKRGKPSSLCAFASSRESHLGSIMEITNIYQATVKTYDYDAFGAILAESGSLDHNAFTYTAREYHAKSGLYYYRERFYDPTVGRFIGQDPIGIAGGTNLHAYVGNNPINRVDPFGLHTIAIIDMGFHSSIAFDADDDGHGEVNFDFGNENYKLTGKGVLTESGYPYGANLNSTGFPKAVAYEVTEEDFKCALKYARDRKHTERYNFFTNSCRHFVYRVAHKANVDLSVSFVLAPVGRAAIEAYHLDELEMDPGYFAK